MVKATMPVGVVVRRTPGVTRWAKWAWQATAVLPGAGPGNWKLLREDDSGAAEYHAATLPLELHRAETEAYMVAMANRPPLVWAILRPGEGDRPQPIRVTASAYEAQDFTDNAEDIVEPLPMPPGLLAWVQDFVEEHHREEPFIKRKRRPHVDEGREDGIGDARVRQAADVYRAPRSIREADG